jgi:glucose/arabinose dehydrogenase
MKKSILIKNGLYFVLLLCCTSCISSRKNNKPFFVKTNEELTAEYQLNKIQLPPGFKISVFAEIPNARSMCWGSNQTLFVGNRDEDKVYAAKDTNNDGRADQIFIIDQNLNMPCGVAFKNGSLFVAEVSRILRYDNIENNLNKPPKPVVVYDKFPTEKHHGWKYIAFGPDEKLYVPVGAPCNVCEEKDSIFATITRMSADGTNVEIFAKGIRNSVGFDWHPVTKELWFTENGRDHFGDNIPADELNTAPQKGMHFGFPYCHQGDTLDPEFGKNKNCNDYTPPAQKLGPHVAALGMQFYTGNMFLPEYKNQIFIAEHGSWNRTDKIGYRVMLARLQNNKVVQYIPFATGWMQLNDTVIGRPVDIEIDKQGALLVSDDKAGVVYRIIFEN